MDVDLFSIEEAGIIAESLTDFAKEAGIITEQEAVLIKNDFNTYFQNELTVVRSFENLRSTETQEKWSKDGYQIYVDHIGTARADQVSALYQSYRDKSMKSKMNGKSCCHKKCKKSCCKKS